MLGVLDMAERKIFNEIAKVLSFQGVDLMFSHGQFGRKLNLKGGVECYFSKGLPEC